MNYPARGASRVLTALHRKVLSGRLSLTKVRDMFLPLSRHNGCKMVPRLYDAAKMLLFGWTSFPRITPKVVAEPRAKVMLHLGL